jgi:pimeloyl-ACP methyl ester carboxylesterase
MLRSACLPVRLNVRLNVDLSVRLPVRLHAPAARAVPNARSVSRRSAQARMPMALPICCVPMSEPRHAPGNARRCLPMQVLSVVLCCLLAIVLLMPGAARAQFQAQTQTPPQIQPQIQPQTRDITLDGRLTLIDLYAPPRPTQAAIVFAHGFMRSRVTFADHAAAMAADGVLALAPDLPYVTDSRKNARALADLVGQLRAGALGPPIERVVLVGFSAGGLAALLAADTPGVVGYVGLDAFDRPGGVGLEAARTLSTPARTLRAPSGFCNAYSISSPWIGALKKLESDRVIDAATHCDFESPTDRACQLFCGRADPARQAIVRQALHQAVRDWLLSPSTQVAAATHFATAFANPSSIPSATAPR